MTNKIKLALLIVVIATSFISCNKNADELLTVDSVKIDNVIFSSSSSIQAKTPGGDTYDEGACIIDNEAGTKCFVSVGKSCSKEHACEKVTSAAQSGNYTKEEIDQKIKLVEQAYGIKYTY